MVSQIERVAPNRTVANPPGPIHEHLIAIQDLAKDFGLPVAVVSELYWPELTRLGQGATIDLYLPLLCERRVRDRLRHRSPAEQAASRHDREVPVT